MTFVVPADEDVRGEVLHPGTKALTPKPSRWHKFIRGRV